MALQSVNPVGANYFRALPSTHQLLIFGQLDVAALLTCRKVCAGWNKQITDSTVLWQKVCQRDYPDSLNAERVILNATTSAPLISFIKSQLAIENNIKQYKDRDAFYFHRTIDLGAFDIDVGSIHAANDKVAMVLFDYGTYLRIRDNCKLLFLTPMGEKSLPLRRGFHTNFVKQVDDKLLYCCKQEGGGTYFAKIFLEKIKVDETSSLSSVNEQMVMDGCRLIAFEYIEPYLYIVGKGSDKTFIQIFDGETAEKIEEYAIEGEATFCQVYRDPKEEGPGQFILTQGTSWKLYSLPTAEVKWSIDEKETISAIHRQRDHLFVVKSNDTRSLLQIYDLKNKKEINFYKEWLHSENELGRMTSLYVHDALLFMGTSKGDIWIQNWKTREPLNEMPALHTEREMKNFPITSLAYEQGNLYYGGGSIGGVMHPLAGCFSFQSKAAIPSHMVRKFTEILQAIEAGRDGYAGVLCWDFLPKQQREAIYNGFLTPKEMVRDAVQARIEAWGQVEADEH